MKKRINVNKKSKDWKARYPLVEIYWLDILSDPSWQSLKGVMQMELPTCVTKGHLVSQTKGVTRVFGATDPSCREPLKSTADPLSVSR
jgi:hypothetical protein